MKGLILVFALVLANTINAQILVKINDNLIAENAIVKADEIKKFEIGFDKPKVLKDYGLGQVTLEIAKLQTNGTYYPMFYFTRNGTNSIEAFLEEVNTFYTLHQEGQVQKIFNIRGARDFLEFLYETKMDSVTMRISLIFKDKIGYETYGDPINLIKPFIVTFDNKINYENFAKKYGKK